MADPQITHRATALLRLFAETSDFEVGKMHVRIQMGNIVPPMFARAITEEIASTLGYDVRNK